MPTPGAQNDADKKAAKAATSQGRHNREVIAHGYAFVTLKKDFVRSLLATRALPLPTAQAGCCWVLPGWGRGAGWALLERGRALGAARARLLICRVLLLLPTGKQQQRERPR